MQGDKAVVIGDRSLSCGHCAAVCPVDAITIHAIDPEASKFATFDADSRWLPHGEFNTVQLVRLMASRRSCRNFKDKPVDRALLADLVKIGATAPSGTNSQMWTFTVLPARESVTALGDQLAMFFKRINNLFIFCSGRNKYILLLVLRHYAHTEKAFINHDRNQYC